MEVEEGRRARRPGGGRAGRADLEVAATLHPLQDLQDLQLLHRGLRRRL